MVDEPVLLEVTPAAPITFIVVGRLKTTLVMVILDTARLCTLIPKFPIVPLRTVIGYVLGTPDPLIPIIIPIVIPPDSQGPGPAIANPFMSTITGPAIAAAILIAPNPLSVIGEAKFPLKLQRSPQTL